MLKCEMNHTCANAVTHLDNKGFIYCTFHGLQRRTTHPCRKLRAYEVKRLERGEAVKRY